VSAEKDIERILSTLRANSILGDDLCADGPSDVHVALADNLFEMGMMKLATGRIAAFRTIGSLPELETNG
jgi:hypothetical protein